MSSRLRFIYVWGLFSMCLSVGAGYFIHYLTPLQVGYIALFLLVYYVVSIPFIREKVGMIKIQHEINVLIREKEQNISEP